MTHPLTFEGTRANLAHPIAIRGVEVLNNCRDGDDDGRRWVFALVALTTPEQTNLRRYGASAAP